MWWKIKLKLGWWGLYLVLVLCNMGGMEVGLVFVGVMVVVMVVDVLLGWLLLLFVCIGYFVIWLGWLIGVIDCVWNWEIDVLWFCCLVGVVGVFVVIIIVIVVGWGI